MIAHSMFGNQVVGNYDTRLATGNAFIYTISTGTYATRMRNTFAHSCDITVKTIADRAKNTELAQIHQPLSTLFFAFFG